MGKTIMSDNEKEVWQVIQEMNKAWTNGHVEALDNFFHRDMVAITATDCLRLEGKDACIASLKAFRDAAQINYWAEINPKVQIYEDTSVVTYYFDMSFYMGGQTITMGGRNMIVMVREDEKWLAVAGQFSQYPG